MAYIREVSTSEDSITVEVAGLQSGYNYSDRRCNWSLNGSPSGITSLGANVTSGGRKTFSGLSANTRYRISCYITFTQNTSTSPVYLSDINVTTDRASTPTVNADYTISYDSTSVTFNITGLTRGQELYFVVRLSSSSSNLVNNYDTATGSRFSKTFTGLSPDTEYACNVRVDGTWIETKEFITDKPARPKPAKWDWDISNGDATATETRNALNALTGKQSTNKFSYRVWNDLCKKVNDVLYYYGYSWSNASATYSNTLMSASDKTLTAVRFNALKNNIGSHHATGINSVSKGDTVYGRYFTTLADKINEWIG